MDYKRLDLLVLVAEYGSLSRAASVVGIAQPALGRQIRKLEEECGTPLLYRHGRGVMLTPAGERVVERVKPLLQQMQSIVSELRSEQVSPGGTVALGMTHALCRLIGLQLITQAKELYPKLKLNIIAGHSGHIHEWISNGRLDIAVLHNTRRSQYISMEHVGSFKLALISPLSSTPTAGDSSFIKLRSLAELPLVLSAKNHGLRRTLERAAGTIGLKIQVAYEVDDLQLMLDLVQRGHAHTILAPEVTTSLVDAGSVESRIIIDPCVTTQLMLVQAPNRPSTRAIRVIESLIKETMLSISPPISSD